VHYVTSKDMFLFQITSRKQITCNTLCFSLIKFYHDDTNVQKFSSNVLNKTMINKTIVNDVNFFPWVYKGHS